MGCTEFCFLDSRPLTSRRGHHYFGRFPLEIHMQLVSIGRALGAVGPLLALLLAVLTREL